MALTVYIVGAFIYQNCNKSKKGSLCQSLKVFILSGKTQ